MLTRLIEACLAHRPIVLLITFIVAAFGLVSLSRLPFDAFPDTTPIQVQVNTTAPALAPLEIERQITFPLEQAIAGLPGLQQVRSISKFGYSQITVIFEDGIDIYLARQVVGERIATAEIPPGIDRPTLGPVATGLGEVFQYLIRSETLSPQELRTLHHWVVRPQMVQVPGVAEINTWGGFEKQYHVLVDPLRLAKYRLTLDDLADLLQRANRNAGGGVLNVSGAAQLIQGRGLVSSVADLEGMVVAQVNGTPIYLRDVADIALGSEIRRGAVTADGEGEVVLGLGFMLMGENSREITLRLKERLAEVQKGLPDTVTLEPVYRRTDLVDQVLDTVAENLFEGALLVVAILFAMLGNLRAGLIVALAIPLSMLFAFNAMLQVGIAGSLMSLGAIDFGLVVDSSVIMIENAARRLEEDRGRRSVLEVVRDAAVEVRKPTLFGELIIAIVYLPVLTLEGVEGKLFRPMALTVIFALLGSMIVSVTLMPVLASYALQRGAGHTRPRFALWLERRYAALLGRFLKVRRVVLITTALIVVGAGFLATQLGTAFVPRLREQAIVINTVRMAGVSLEESVRYGTHIEKLLLAAFPDEIAHIWTRTGTGEITTDPMGLEVSDVFITLTPCDQWRKGETQDALMAAMEGALYGLPGMRSIFTQPIEMRVNEMVAGVRADIAVKLFGDDFEVLRREGDRIRERMEAIPGAADVTLEQLTGWTMLVLEVDRAAAGRHGVPVAEILAYIDSLGTRRVGRVVEGQRTFDLVLKWQDAARESVETVGRIPVLTASGKQIPLSNLVTIKTVEGPATVNREWAKRRIMVQANVRDRDIGSFVKELRAALDQDLQLPVGYTTQIGGQFENMERAMQRLSMVVPLSFLLVFSLLYLTYGRIGHVLRIFTGIPFGAVGGIAALWLTDTPFSVSAGIGFIALSGVSVLGDMVLVSRVTQLQKQGQPLLTAVREAARTRMAPVLMTGLVAALGFVPMAMNTGVGAEIQRPLALVVIGGMTTATVATLFVLPLLYAEFNRREETAAAT
ncbi:efflux RND transporter permease subunit [Acanthopleuribacter pedis]|uniref:Efflux RND transporter permease subunit n=1 Tax=Acanthopleuribacter pedis TaxID=442870 RepID=A0A8J7QG33_9BACT|nr:CusA/CzcA family heavy metal efflux RND transporter [Acanthopleuribacter pedis]MBO1317948.1 efflux RND transporter permease subunit [Acanthopleuribacter pedis]